MGCSLHAKKIEKIDEQRKKNRKRLELVVADLCRVEAAEMYRPLHLEPPLGQVLRPEKIFLQKTWGNMKIMEVLLILEIEDVLQPILTGRQRAQNHWQEQRPI